MLIREPLGKGTEATRQEFGQVADGVPRREDTQRRALLKGQPEYPGSISAYMLQRVCWARRMSSASSSNGASSNSGSAAGK